MKRNLYTFLLVTAALALAPVYYDINYHQLLVSKAVAYSHDGGGGDGGGGDGGGYEAGGDAGGGAGGVDAGGKGKADTGAGGGGLW